MSARMIDGRALAAELRGKIATATAELANRYKLVPGLAVALVGHDPASEVYVRGKTKQTVEAGMKSVERYLPETISEAELLAQIAGLNADPEVHGVLVQFPLPPQIDPYKVIAAIDPRKDVDGFHPLNAGWLATGHPGLAPSTAIGCILLAKSVHSSLEGMSALMVGRSNVVGKPLAQELLAENATVTIAHSHTRNLPELCRESDLLFVAVGHPHLIRGDWIKPGATVVDIGINRIATTDCKGRIVGDVAFDEAVEVAGAITPVPGGVGPMTIACLLLNTVRAACAIAKVPLPAVLA